jgi:hypothetical protein
MKKLFPNILAVLSIILLCGYLPNYAEKKVSPVRIKVKKIEGLLKIYTPKKKQILVSPGDKFPTIPSGSRIKVLFKNAEISIGAVTVSAKEKGLFQIWHSQKTGKTRLQVDKGSKGNIKATIKSINYILNPKEEVIITFEAGKSRVLASKGNIEVVDSKGKKTLSEGKRHTIRLRKPVKKARALPVKEIKKIKLVKHTGTIKFITPDITRKTIKKGDKPPFIPIGSVILVVSGKAKIEVDNIILTMEKGGIIQPKFNTKTKKISINVPKKSKGTVKATVGDTKVFLKRGQKIYIEFNKITARFTITAVKGRVRMITPSGEIFARKGKSIVTGPLLSDVVIPEPEEPILEEASPSSP